MISIRCMHIRSTFTLVFRVRPVFLEMYANKYIHILPLLVLAVWWERDSMNTMTVPC